MEEIKNPEKQNSIIALMVAALGIIAMFIPYVITAIAAYHFYFVYFGIVFLLFGLGFAFFYYRRYQQFLVFIENKEEALVWRYEDEDYLGFIGELNQIQRNISKKKVWILLAIIFLISVCLFIFLEPQYKWTSVAFFIFFGLISLVFTLILPESFKYRAQVKPYVSIVKEDSAYLMGRFHRWKKAQAKIKDHDNGEKIYKVLAINYEAMTRNGKLFQEWTALMPNPQDKEEILIAKAWAKKINTLSKKREEEKKNKKSPLERLFYRMLGRKEEITEINQKNKSKK